MRDRPIWFRITLNDCNGQNLATWNYDETFPVVAPMFTYPNEDASAPFTLKIDHVGSKQKSLPAHCDLNHAIHNEVQMFIRKIIEGKL